MIFFQILLTDTEISLKTLENRCRTTHHRLKRAKDLANQDKFYVDFKLDLDDLRACWNTNLSSFSLIDMIHDNDVEGEWAKMAELIDIEESFGNFMFLASASIKITDSELNLQWNLSESNTEIP